MSTLLELAEANEYTTLFLRYLGWNAPDHPRVSMNGDDGALLTATNVSSYKGIRVWVCPTRPGSKMEAELDRQLAQVSTDRLVIFHDDDEQVWRWPVRRRTTNTAATRLTSHRHRTGVANAGFANRLAAIQLPDDLVLDANAVLAKLRSAFDTEAQNETKRASKLMARMYTAMESAYPASTDPKQRDHEISVTLARILFMMFGDDTDMWATDTFRTFIHRTTSANGSNISERLNTLFEHLDTPPEGRRNPDLDLFPYVNGGIFNERVKLPTLSAQFRDVLLEACVVDWATISPAIFGSMFQSVRDAAIRRELGEHYTSEQNILRTLEPLFLDELRGEIDHARTLKNEAAALRRLRARLGRIRFLDPACGCGNFIIVAYRELRRIELDILSRLQELTGDPVLSLDPNVFLLEVTLDHFHGIEIDEWPARIAETAMFLVDRQCDLELKDRFGEVINRLPIRTQAKIVVGNALRTDWATICEPAAEVVIAGNPPFLGIALRSEEQTAELKLAWGTDYHGTLDYVTGWHAKAMSYFAETPGVWAFVTTNSITQGEAVAPLFEPVLANGWNIKFAHRTFAWTSEAPRQAVVHCAIVGFAKIVARPRLFDYASLRAAPHEIEPVTNITPYLTVGPTVIVHPSTRPLNSQLGEVVYGNKPTDGGGLIIDVDELDEFLADPIAARYVRRYVGARELLHGDVRYCLWLVDATTDELRSSAILRERVDRVRQFRARSDAASTRAAASTPHLFRQLAQPDTSYLCIPAHSLASRPYFLAARLGPEAICSNANFLAVDTDGFMFAVISSRMFMTWQLAVGGRIKSDPRFNKLLTWNTFPLPHVDRSARQHFIESGAAVQQARDQQPGLSLAQQYARDAMSADLIDAHATLDRKIETLFGISTADPTELQRLDCLFTAYARLASPLLATPARPRSR